MQVHPYYFSKTKRIFDFTLSAFLLVILIPLLVCIALTIFLTSGWPVLFHQKRYGKNKKVFTIHKFRVMAVGSEKNQWRYRAHNQAPEPMYKNWNDPRYTKIGKWLSSTGLDELPQLWNIINGDMSLIGPRPLPINESKRLPKNWVFRFEVKPGIFSRWSISPKRHSSLATWKGLEQSTLLSGNIVFDIKMILHTIINVLIRR